MNPNLAEQLDKLPGFLGGHVVLSGAALATSVAISLPLALAVARSPRFRWPVVTAAGVIQTIPSLALLALMVPLLGLFGFWPALVALVLYGMLPIVRNTVTGIVNVDPELVEAARGLGMTERQILRKVELPLALPVIVAGVRTSAVWLVGMATLSTPVGQTSLGNFIFGGLQTRNWTAVLVGCVAAATLAIALDALLALLERAAEQRSSTRLAVALVGLVLIFGGGALAPRLAQARSRPAPPAATPPTTSPSRAAQLGTVRVGSKNFTEQYILAALIERRLSAAGLAVSHTSSLGSTIAFDALVKSDIDVYVDYTGTLWASVMKHDDVPPPWRVQQQVAGYLADKYGVRDLGSLGFENAYALAMRRDNAEALGVHSIADLARHARTLSIGSDYEFFQRPEWKRLQQTYGLAFETRRSFDPTFMYDAVKQGEVDVITAFSSDGRIAAYDLVTLSDPRHAFPPYDAVLLLSPRVAGDVRVVRALSPLVGSIDVARMRHANSLVDREADKLTPDAAAAWLDGRR